MTVQIWLKIAPLFWSSFGPSPTFIVLLGCQSYLTAGDSHVIPTHYLNKNKKILRSCCTIHTGETTPLHTMRWVRVSHWIVCGNWFSQSKHWLIYEHSEQLQRKFYGNGMGLLAKLYNRGILMIETTLGNSRKNCHWLFCAIGGRYKCLDLQISRCVQWKLGKNYDKEYNIHFLYIPLFVLGRKRPIHTLLQ